jgi:hypothetical protein
MLNAPLNVNIHERTLTSSYGAFIEDLAPRLDSYQQTISATCGFESMTANLKATLLEALRFCERLFCGCIVYGKDADTAWEGFLAGVSFRIGDETVNVSLDPVANRVRVRFTTYNGVPGFTATASHAPSQALYGVRDHVEGVGVVIQAAAEALRNAILAERRLPRPQHESAIATGQSGAVVDVTLTFAGWYTTLDWVLTERNDTTTEVTTTQVGALIGTASPGIGATNPFLSTSTARIVASGVSDTRKIDPDTPYRMKIETLLQMGNSSNQRFAWGVYEGRVFVVEVWAGATPTTATYRRRIGDAVLENSSGALVMPWAARPNAILETTDLLNVGPTSGAIELPGRRFVERWTVDIDASGWRLTPESAAADNIGVRLARLQ